jgi:hypothetical protein
MDPNPELKILEGFNGCVKAVMIIRAYIPSPTPFHCTAVQRLAKNPKAAPLAWL